MAISTITMTTFDAFLKEYYVEQKNLQNLGMKAKKALGLIPKVLDATGDTWVQPISVSNPGGDAATYASASSNASSGVDSKYYGTWKDRYAVEYIDDKVIRLSKDPRGAFKSAKLKMDGLTEQFKQSVALQIYRDEGGWFGKVALSESMGGNGTVTLATPYDNVSQFMDKDLVVSFSSVSTGASPTATRKVTGTNRGGGSVTVAAGGTLGGVIGANDYIYKAGDDGKALCGFSAWVPDTAPTDTFKNCDRSVDSVGLGGLRLAAQGMLIQEAIIQAVSDAVQFGAEPDAVLIHPKKFAMLVKELGSNARYEFFPGKPFSGSGKAAFGYDGLMVSCNGVNVPVFADAFCQKERGWVIQWDTWALRSAGPVPFVRGEDTDNIKMLRQGDTTYIFELFAYYEQVCSAPGWNVVIKFDSST